MMLLGGLGLVALPGYRVLSQAKACATKLTATD
jgi:hypothetical protein